MRWLVLGFVILLSGCAASVPSAYHDMTAEQIRAAVTDRTHAWGCVSAVYAGASITTVFGSSDKGIPAEIEIGKDCTVKSKTAK